MRVLSATVLTLNNCWYSGSSLSGHTRKRTAYDRLLKIPFELPIQILHLLIPVSGRGTLWLCDLDVFFPAF